ncbi:hypothetical protein GCM10010215_40020 [Streptomyces virginiae]|uniref:Uncharacterized protein n=1 Tax=Streptomyces virginiae TaxID=1961 RepID=A0ABQ3NZQ0_STRVG|nr:hypothetical protein [Streptomyces virginiae]MBP2343805.1 hypothetical protein [Streptomyces virginiae]GGQ10972.1 hypothetical protein GCM10010215_40020 [Streptomyces virginiae]GHI18197.1 hypothetical protein Scinn_76600 [Streptomyces virginiae]
MSDEIRNDEVHKLIPEMGENDPFDDAFHEAFDRTPEGLDVNHRMLLASKERGLTIAINGVEVRPAEVSADWTREQFMEWWDKQNVPEQIPKEVLDA